MVYMRIPPLHIFYLLSKNFLRVFYYFSADVLDCFCLTTPKLRSNKMPQLSKKSFPFFFCLLSFFILLLSCKRATEPLVKDAAKRNLDTSSHSFAWQIDTLPGTVFDISGLDENNVWLVGEFSRSNSQTGETEKFNYGYWNGKTWKLQSILKEGPYMGIHVFNKNNIWLTDGGMIHWNGKYWKLYHPWNMGILNETEGGVTKVWGLDSSNVFFIGLTGTIIHFDGYTFKKMESKTNVNLTHIYGIDENHIWVVGDDRGLHGGHSVLLFFNGSSWKVKYHYRYNEGPPFEGGPIGQYRGIWADKDSIIMGSGHGFWHESIITGKGRIEPFSFHPIGAEEKIFARNRNDLFMIGHFYTLHHYNGKSWKRYISFLRKNDNFYAGSFVSDDCVFVGGNRFVYRGYR
ncbi:hypothetical protein Cabys_4005 [Caldithrix abyssi DSM 13497]|nr:hypothetical protein Cabys_4005 [Caldithrix abyssi DSM 13497]